MLTAVTIKGLRGIREGELRDLTPLVVLVGPNGSGKSTILEAVNIGAASSPSTGVVNVLQAREGEEFALGWLLWKRGSEGPAEVAIRITPGTSSRKVVLKLQNKGRRIEVSGSQTNLDKQYNFRDGSVQSADRGNFSIGDTDDSWPRFIAPNPLFTSPVSKLSEPLSETFSELVRLGLRGEAMALIENLVPGLERLDILTENGSPVLYLVFEDRAIPASHAGDGIHLLLRVGLQLATIRDGIALMEEPETHLHPAAIRQCARAIVAASRRKAQVILTTHSLEVIDSLLAELTMPADEDLLSVYRLRLDNGLLQSSRFDGADVTLARGDIMDDLR